MTPRRPSSAAPSILVVDDQPDIRDMLRLYLTREGFEVRGAADAGEALRMMRERLPSLVLLDWMMAGMDGIDLLRYMRLDATMAEVPVIMLTAKGDEDERVDGLLSGADDYIVKPFSLRELHARIRARLRRPADGAKAPEGRDITLGKIKMNAVRHQLEIDSRPVSLSATEFRMLYFFITHPGRVFQREQILDHVWGVHKFLDGRTIDVYVLRLRRLLAKHGLDNVIETVRGVGYRLSA